MSNLKDRIDQDLKQALLDGNKVLVLTLRGLKSVILYAEVAEGRREQGLDDQAIVVLLAKEAKKRQESADLYRQGGDEIRAQAELQEKKIIEKYLPQQLDDQTLSEVVEQTVQELGVAGPQDMGRVIAAVKQKTAGGADGGRIALTVRRVLERQ